MIVKDILKQQKTAVGITNSWMHRRTILIYDTGMKTYTKIIRLD